MAVETLGGLYQINNARFGLMRDRSPEAKAERLKRFIKSMELDREIRLLRSKNKKRDVLRLKKELNPIYRKL